MYMYIKYILTEQYLVYSNYGSVKILHNMLESVHTLKVLKPLH